MKKITLLSAAIISILAAVSCSRDSFKETIAPDTIRTTISATLDPTKTVLGDKDGSSYPNYWKEGDQISVNGVTSDALDASVNGKSSADFTFASAISTPYYAAYPAAAVSNYTIGSATLTIPATQTYVAGSYDPAAFIMGGTSNNAASVSLTPCVSIFHLSLTGTASISSIKLTGQPGAALSGTFTTDFSTFTPDEVSNVVEMVAASPVALPAEFFICIPSSLSGTFRVQAFDNEGGSMSKVATIKSALAAGQMYSASAAYSGTYNPEITAEGITSSTAVICWGNSPEAAYTIGVYSDSGCSSLVDSYSVSADNSCWGGNSPRFCISGLTPATTYYVKVTNVAQSADSNILPVTTEAFDIVEVSNTPADVDDVILAEDFSELRWDSELIGRGVGYFPTSQDSFVNSEVSQFLPIDTNTEKVLASQTTAVVLSRLAHWAQGANNNLYIHPGYIKLVGNKKVTHIVTPALDNIPDGIAATVEVEVTASPYFSESSASFCTTNAIVAVQTDDLNELTDDTKTNTLDLTTNKQSITLDAASAWKTYKVTLSNVVKGNRIAFGAADGVSGNDARMLLSDIKITIKALNAPGDVIASVKSVSSSTASFTWTHLGEDAAYDVSKPYTASLYSDSACSSLVVSHDFEAGDSSWDGKRPCFSFGGLAPSTTYWLVVEDTENARQSAPVSVTTDSFTAVDATTVSDAGIGDVILAEDFSEIGWGPDEFAVAAGFVPSLKNLNAPSGVNPSGAYTTYNNTGNRIFGSGVDLGGSRLSHGWGFFGNSAVYLRNAYLRITTTSSGARTHLVTPTLSGIPEGKIATLEVSVTATKLESNTNDVAVFVEKGLTMNETVDNTSGSYKKYTGASLSDGQALGITTVKEWETKTVTITNVDRYSQLAIGSYENIDTKNRFSISDVRVTITALADDPEKKIKDNATFMEFVNAVAGGNKTLDARVVSSFEVTSANAAAFESIEDYEGTFDGHGKTITGLTKPLFNDLKGTVKDLTLNSTINITSDQLDLGILANVLSGTATGCTSQGSVTFNVAGGVTGEHHIAGMFGQAASGSSITDCTNEASVTNETSNAGGNENELMVGGVLGTFWGVDFTISDCENTGAVINNGAWNKDVSVGGIIGQAGNSSSLTCTMTVSDCTNSGPVTNNGETSDATNSVGGVIGWIRFGTYTDNTNTGIVTNTGNAKQNRVGGLIGYLDKNATFDNNSNSGEVSNTGEATDINYVGGLLGRMQTGNTFLNNSNSGTVSNSGNATNYVYMGGIVGYLDKSNVLYGATTDGKTASEYKLTNSGNIVNGGSAKNICIGGILGRNSTGVVAMTGSSSKYSSNSGNITDNSGSAKSNGGDLSIGGIAGYTTTGLKVQYGRNSGNIYVTGDKGSTAINVGGIGGWISNASFNFNNCKNTGDVTVDATTTGSIWAAGIVACPKPNSTKHYYWRSNATIDTHLATVGGENYTAGLMATVEGSDASSTFTMIGHRLAGTVWGSKTTTGLFCCTKNTSASFSITKGDASNPCMIAPGTVRKDNVNDDTINDISDVTIGVLAGGAGSTYDPTSAIADEHIVVAAW